MFSKSREIKTNIGTYHVNLEKQLFKTPIFWKGVFVVGALHIFSCYGFYLIFCNEVSLKTLLFQSLLLFLTKLSVTAGAHRLWTHRSYQARWPLKLFLAIFQTMAFQFSIKLWAISHRIHHKYTDTAADPHNSTRGFWFSHIGWLLLKRTPECTQKRREIDVKDLDSDPIVYWQSRLYYPVFWPFFFVLVPTIIPMYMWGESAVVAWHVNCVRFIIALHQTFLINSLCHGANGNRPYDMNISAIDSFHLAWHTVGEGWHNYHHVFPWDYKAAEATGFLPYNPTTSFINLCASVGLASNLKTATPEQIIKRKLRTGEAARPNQDPTNSQNNSVEEIEEISPN